MHVLICPQEFWICIVLWYRVVLWVDTSATEERNVFLWNVGIPTIRQHGVIRLSGCLCFGKIWCLHVRIKQSTTLSAEGGFFFLWRCDPTQVMTSLFLRFLDHTQWCTTVGRTPLDKWSAHCRDLYLKTHNTHNRQTSMPPVGFKPTISAGERPQTYALDRAATGAGRCRG